MTSNYVLAIFVLSFGFAIGSSLRWDIPKLKQETSQPGDLELLSELLSLSEDDYRMILDELLRVALTHHHGICEKETCKICLKKLPIAGRLCFELDYMKSESNFHLMLSRNGHELVCVTLANELPKICLFHHICAQVVDMNISGGKICASFEFNGIAVVKDHCTPL